MNTQSKDQIVILGGGAGGLGLTIRLADKFRKTPVEVVLIDRDPTHLWKPLLHEVATGSLDGNHDEVRYAALARKHKFRFILASVQKIDAENSTLHLETGSSRLPEIPRHQKTIPYTQLAIALGSISNDFSTPGVEKHAILLDSRSQAEQFHQSFVSHLHRLNNLQKDNQEILDIVIIGGGATGVELAADLHHVAAQLDDYGFESFPPEKLKITLFEGADRLLGHLPQRISQQVESELDKLGVHIQTGARVINVEASSVQSADMQLQKSDLTVWAAGIKAPVVLAESGLNVDATGRVMVDDALNLPDYPAIFVLGDCAHCEQPDGDVVPPRAQSAHQMSACVYRNIVNQRNGKPLKKFSYHDFGSLVSLSDYSTVGNLMGNLMRGTLFIEGWLARIMYRLLYRRHQLGIHGFSRTGLIILGDFIHRVTRSRIKLH